MTDTIADVKRAAESTGIARITYRTFKASVDGYVTVYPVEGEPLDVGNMRHNDARSLAGAVGTPDRRIPLTVHVLGTQITPDGGFSVAREYTEA